MTEKEYRRHPAISRSELWHIRESPEKFKWYREHPEQPSPDRYIDGGNLRTWT